MVERIQYYFQRVRDRLRRQGLKASFREIVDFLVRRKFFLQFVLESIEYYLVSRFRSLENTLIAIHHQNYEQLKADRILIYVSFDLESKLQEHVLQQVAAFKCIGYAVVFVTTSASISSEQIALLKSNCALIVHRKNEGYDFGSWKLGYELVRSRIDRAQSVILMNDSCLGPYFELEPSIEKMQKTEDAVYGITKSYEITEYIQSYFFHFGRKVIEVGIMQGFISRIRILNTKWAIVRFFEIGGSKFLKQQGVPLLGLVEPKDPIIAEKMAMSGQTEPSRDPVARWLIEKRVNPFYKRSNLRS